MITVSRKDIKQIKKGDGGSKGFLESVRDEVCGGNIEYNKIKPNILNIDYILNMI